MLANGVDIALLARGLGPNDLAAVAEQHVIARAGGAHVLGAQAVDGAIHIVRREGNAGSGNLHDVGEQAREQVNLAGCATQRDGVPPHGDAGLAPALSSTDEGIRRPGHVSGIDIRGDGEAHLGHVRTMPTHRTAPLFKLGT